MPLRLENQHENGFVKDCEGKDGEEKNSGGGGFSERSPSPGPPPEERLALGGVRFCLVGSACELDVASISLAESTAADRAAADMRRWGNWIAGKPMARAIGFPAIGVWSDWRRGNFSFICKKKTVSVCGRRRG